MAMISESAERRPMAIRMPNSRAIGTVSTTMCGSDSIRSRPTVPMESDCRMIVAARSKSCLMRMIEV